MSNKLSHDHSERDDRSADLSRQRRRLTAVLPTVTAPDLASGREGLADRGVTASMGVMVHAWDLFISHASEDKDMVAIPLAQVLRRAGLRVWLDRQEIRIGDSLHEKIDEGLANSRYGVVILSPSFLAKRFPRKELDGLLAREDASERKVILPVWHQLDKATLAEYSPILANRLAGNTANGIPFVASEIINVVTEPGSGAFHDIAPTPLRLLIELLDRQPTGSDVVQFLALHPRIIHRALGSQRGSERWSTAIGSVTVDLCTFRTQPTSASIAWNFVQFQPPTEPLFIASTPYPSLNARVVELRRAIKTARSPRCPAWMLKPILLQVGVSPLLARRPQVRGFVIAGRRQQLSQDEVESLQRYNQELSGLTVRTYDWIIDIAAEET